MKRISPYTEENMDDYPTFDQSNQKTAKYLKSVNSFRKVGNLIEICINCSLTSNRPTTPLYGWTSWLPSTDIPKKLEICVEVCVKNTEVSNKLTVKGGLKWTERLSPLLFNIVFDMVIKKANINKEIFTNQEPQTILAFSEDIVTIRKNTARAK